MKNEYWIHQSSDKGTFPGKKKHKQHTKKQNGSNLNHYVTAENLYDNGNVMVWVDFCFVLPNRISEFNGEKVASENLSKHR